MDTQGTPPAVMRFLQIVEKAHGNPPVEHIMTRKQANKMIGLWGSAAMVETNGETFLTDDIMKNRAEAWSLFNVAVMTAEYSGAEIEGVRTVSLNKQDLNDALPWLLRAVRKYTWQAPIP